MMKTRVLSANADGAIKEAAEILAAGGLVGFPTETVYGLGANALDEAAVKSIFEAKGRPQDNPLIVHLSDPMHAEKYAYTSSVYDALARAFMPGPLTVILPKRACIPDVVTAGLDCVALRTPIHPVAHAMLCEAALPVAAPSANRSGRPSPTTAAHVLEDMDGRIPLILDGGASEIGLESTVVKLTQNGLLLLRPGAVTPEELRRVCPNVEIADAALHQISDNEKVQSPGMKYRHYAPRAPLTLLDGTRDDVRAFVVRKAAERRVAFLCYDEDIPLLEKTDLLLLPIGKESSEEDHGRLLFDALRRADTACAEQIYAYLPSCEGYGLALYNRMIRAAAHTIEKVPCQKALSKD